MKKFIAILITLALLIPLSAFAVVEDFTTYTIKDDISNLTVTATKVTAVDVDRDKDVWLYYDYTAAHFDALEAYFTMYMSSVSTGDGSGATGFSNNIYDLNDWVQTEVAAWWANWDISIKLVLGDFAVFDSYDAALENTPYYPLMERAAGNTTVTLKIYDDANRTNLVDTLTVAGVGTGTFQYLFGFVNFNSGAGGNDFDGYFENLDVGEVAAAARRTIQTQFIE